MLPKDMKMGHDLLSAKDSAWPCLDTPVLDMSYGICIKTAFPFMAFLVNQIGGLP